MFNKQLVTCVKVAGKILKEKGDKVFIPFGSEYSLYLKNLNSLRAAVRIEIDGQSVTDGQDLIIQPNSSVDIERFIKNGNLSSGNKFKFIERTGKIEAHRGIGGEDGLLRVEFQFEKVYPKTIVNTIKTVHEHIHHDYYDPWHYPYRPWRPYYWNSDRYYGICGSASNVASYSNVSMSDIGTSSVSLNAGDTQKCSATADSAIASGSLNATQTMSFNASAPIGGSAQSVSEAAPTRGLLRSRTVKPSPTMDYVEQEANDAGITVACDISNQSFRLVDSFELDDDKHVIVLKLLGAVGEKAVKQAITVKHKEKCATCGTRNRGANKFCRECGTALELI